MFVRLALRSLVNLSRSRRKDFDHEIWCAPDVLIGHDTGTIARNVKEVGFNDIEIGEHDVQRRHKGFTNRILLEVHSKQREETSADPLVFGIRRWRHVMLAVDDLVAPSIIGKVHEIFVRKLDGRRPFRSYHVTSLNDRSYHRRRTPNRERRTRTTNHE